MFSFKACLQLSLLVASVLLKPANAECECGYSVDGQIFTNKIGYDFSEYPNTSGTKLAEENTLSDWVIQSWGVPETINRAYSNETSDEVLLPRLNQHENVWIEDGSLVLRQIGYTKEDEKNGNPVRVAELVSKRVDIKYGTFRARYRVETEPGATGGGVSGFFYYFNNTQETDIEILTNDGPGFVHYTQHPAYNETSKTVIPLTTGKQPLRKLANIPQEHRFDWFPESTTFYQDAVESMKIEKNTPSEPGQIHFNMWANGGKWSGKPSDKDIHMRIDYIALFFNTTDTDNTAFNLRCAQFGWTNSEALCQIPSERAAVALAKLDSAGIRSSFSSRWLLLLSGLGSTVFLFC